MITSEHAFSLKASERLFTRLSAFRVHPALRDVAVTGIASLFVGMAAMGVISILGKTVGPVLLGEYLLIRRMASWFQAGVQLPSAIGLPRFVAFNLDKPRLIRQTYFASALLSSSSIALALGGVLLFWHASISQLFFGSTQLDHLVLPLCLFLLGLALNGVVFGYYQGMLQMMRASVFQFCNLALVPLLITIAFKSMHSISLIVDGMGLSMCLCAGLFAWPIARDWESGLSTAQLRRQTTELLSYGSARIFGDLGLQAMLSLPAVVAAHYFPIASVSFLLLGGSFVTVVSAASLPLANVLLSRVSRSVARDQTDELRERVTRFVTALIELAAFISPQMVLFCDVIVRAWVGPSFLAGLLVIQISILAVPFYLFYAGLRGVIDAVAVKAHNTRNILISGTVFLCSMALIKLYVAPDRLLEGLAVSGVIGLAVLAVCTLRTIRNLVQIDLKWLELVPGLMVAAAFGACSLFLHQWKHAEFGLVSVLLYELFACGLYFAIMWSLRSSWVQFIVSSMFLPAD